MERIILIGGGGHCKSVIDSLNSLNRFEIAGIIDLECNVGKKISNIPIIDYDANLFKYKKMGIENVFITIGSIGDVSVRKKLDLEIQRLGFKMPVIADKSAIIAENVTIGRGTFVGKGAIINANVDIGDNCIINSGTIIEHDCEIGDFVHVSPAAVLCGGVKVDENSHIGANSTIIQYMKIGKNSIIGAGSVIINDVGDFKKVYGNPGKEAKYEKSFHNSGSWCKP